MSVCCCFKYYFLLSQVTQRLKSFFFFYLKHLTQDSLVNEGESKGFGKTDAKKFLLAFASF